MRSCNLRVTSQLPLCSNPLSMDLYAGCPHGCKYCFARGHSNFNYGSKGDNYELAEPRNYKPFIELIKGDLNKQRLESVLIKKKQPIHIGGMADPFPAGVEEELGHTKRFIEEIRDYPCIWSTKNPLVDYADLMAKGNHILQCTIIGFGEVFERIEPNVPAPEERIEVLRKYKGKVKKIIIRMQPVLPWLYNEESIDEYMRKISEVGDGVVIEFLKKKTNEKFAELSNIMGMDMNAKMQGYGKLEGNDHLISSSIRLKYLKMIKKYANKYGLEFYSGENEFRDYGDSCNCCGIAKSDDDVFQSKANFNLSEFIFELKKRGRIYQDELIERIPEEFNIRLTNLGWNSGNRKNYHEWKTRTLRDEVQRWISSKNQNHPAIFYKNVNIKRDKKNGKIFFEYVEDNEPISGEK